jgi:beta-lactamase regulating signal transducer with metallopeptidase domain
MSAILAAFINAGTAGAAIAFAAWLALRMAPCRAVNAATRYAIWWTTLLLVVALPLFFLPHHDTPIAAPQPVAPSETAAAKTTDTVAPTASVELPAPSRWPQFPVELSAGVWPVRVLSIWGTVALLMLLRLCAGYVALERRKRNARPAEHPGLCATEGLIRVLVSSDIASPMAAGLFRPAILIPERLIDELSDDELDQIRIHETAHLLRRDDIALLFQRAVEALFALHPVVRWITRRIDLEREIACDDFVVEQTGQAGPYASCLTRVVEIAGSGSSSIVAAAATEDRSHLARRIEMLLDKTRHKGTRLLKAPLLVTGIALIAMTCLALRMPGMIAFSTGEKDDVQSDTPPVQELSQPPEAPLPPAFAEAPQANRNHSTTIRSSNGHHTSEIHIRGDVQFTEDETDVKAMSPDASFSYQESYFLTSRRYQATADSSGHITRRYLINGREKPIDGDGKAWLRAALPDLLRESGVDVPQRVRRILKQGGAAAVLAEIAKISGDGSKVLHLRELATIGNLTTDQFQSILRLARGISSDGEKASLLVSLVPYALKDNLRVYTFEALETVSSDGEKHRVLTYFIRADTSSATLTLVARAAAGISSDGEKAAVLVDLAPYLRGNRDLSHPFFRAAQSISSDGERARVLMAVMSSAGDQHDTLVDAIRTAGSISSDGEKAQVLIHADGYWKDDEPFRGAYFDAARSVSSDGEKARVLIALIGRAGLSDRTLIETVHCASTISSDGEKAVVLVAIANRAYGKSAVREEIKTAASTVSSEGEYRRVMTALELRANRP